MGKSLREQLESDPMRNRCSLHGIDHVCLGRVTREHAMYYAGKKIQERWAIVFLCAHAHGVDGYPRATTKDRAEWVALNQATDEDFSRFPRKFPSFAHERLRLNAKYGKWEAPTDDYKSDDINY